MIRAEKIEPCTIATIHYLATDTDQPKGAMFDQGQRLKSLQSIAQWFTCDEDDLAYTVPSVLGICAKSGCIPCTICYLA